MYGLNRSWSAISSALVTTFLLGSCALANNVGDIKMNDVTREQVKLSDVVLSFEPPSLKPSKGLPPVRVSGDVDLEQTTEEKVLFRGNWDGPRHQVLSAKGTLDIALLLVPWPEAIKPLTSCEKKAMAYMDRRFQTYVRRFERGIYSRMPIMDISNIQLAGRKAYLYKVDLATPAREDIIIPFDDKFFIEISILSISKSHEDWNIVSRQVQERFLDSLQLTGAVRDCD